MGNVYRKNPARRGLPKRTGIERPGRQQECAGDDQRAHFRAILFGITLFQGNLFQNKLESAEEFGGAEFSKLPAKVCADKSASGSAAASR